MSLLAREIRVTLDRGAGWLTASVLFLAVASLGAVGLGGQPDLLRAAGPGLAWAAVLLAVICVAPALFARDAETGALDQMRLRGASRLALVGAKVGAVLLVVLVPVTLLSVGIAQLLFLTPGETARLLLALAAGAPALASHAAMLGALTLRRGGSLLVGALVLLPLLAPTLIFGVEAVTAESLVGLEMQALAGLSLIGTVVGCGGAVAALAAQDG